MTTLMASLRACRNAVALPACERFVEAFVCEVGPALRLFINAHARPDLAEDAYQETLIAIALKVGHCRANTESQVWRWCYTVARNKIADQARQADLENVVSLELETVRQAVEASGGDERIGSEEREELAFAMELLHEAKPPCVGYLWEAFALSLTYVEMAKLHGLSADAMRMKVNRCLELVRELVRKKARPKHE